MTLTEWAVRHNIPFAAVQELHTMFCLEGTAPYAGTGVNVPTSEAQVQQLVRLEASRKGHRLWRNNNGASKLENGSFVRWGLANDSEALNKRFKSSDLIGVRSNGRFMAREVKPPGWVYTGTDRERAQLAFITFVQSFGGDACFCTGEGSIT
jgi:hypothetical protein